MIFIDIQNPTAFFKRVISLDGAVEYVNAIGEYQDLKPVAQQFLQVSEIVRSAQIPILETRLSSTQDTARMVRFMMDANLV